MPRNKNKLSLTLWGGRVQSRARWGMSKSWYRWGGVGYCSLNSPKPPTRHCTPRASSHALEVHWPAAQPLTHSFHRVEKPPEKCPGENGDSYIFRLCLFFLQDLITNVVWLHILLTWSHSDCNIVPTSSLHCCCGKEWSAGGTNKASSKGNRSASCSSPDTDPDRRCSAALLQAFCDTRASVKESRRRTWPQHTALPSALQLARRIHLKYNSEHEHKQPSICVLHSRLQLLQQQLQQGLLDE